MRLQTSITSLLFLTLALSCADPAQAAPPENAVGELLFAARKLDGMKRLSGSDYYSGGKQGSTGLVLIERSVAEDHVRTEFVQFRKSGGWEGERFSLNFGGSIRSLEIARGEGQGDPKPEDVVKGTLEAGKLVFRTGKGEEGKREIELPADPILGMPAAIFVIAPYYDLLPEGGLAFAALMGQDAAPGFKLARGEAKGETQSVVLSGMGLTLTIWVSTAEATRGQVQSLVIDGDTKVRLSEAEGAKAMAELQAKGKAKPGDTETESGGSGFASPKAAVEAFVAACQKGDMKAVGACFSPAAPKEFQTLRDGTCPPKEFKKLCVMFEACIIGEASESEGAAKVEVDLGDRKESLTIVREKGRWLILDF